MVGTWFDIKEGCSMRSSVGGSNLAHLMLGETELELAFDMDSLREFVKICTAALAEMDSRYEQECAEYEAQDGEHAPCLEGVLRDVQRPHGVLQDTATVPK
jgi:hypothetical protein